MLHDTMWWIFPIVSMTVIQTERNRPEEPRERCDMSDSSTRISTMPHLARDCRSAGRPETRFERQAAKDVRVKLGLRRDILREVRDWSMIGRSLLAPLA